MLAGGRDVPLLGAGNVKDLRLVLQTAIHVEESNRRCSGKQAERVKRCT